MHLAALGVFERSGRDEAVQQLVKAVCRKFGGSAKVRTLSTDGRHRPYSYLPCQGFESSNTCTQASERGIGSALWAGYQFRSMPGDLQRSNGHGVQRLRVMTV